MLDAFLEVVSGHTKVAEARGRLMASLERLPSRELHKIASGELALKAGAEDDTSWLDKFRDSPLFDEALELEKEDLDIQMQEQHRRQVETEMRAQLPTWDETDLRRTNLSIKRKLLELDLAGANLAGADASEEELGLGGQEGEDAAPPDLEAAEAAAMPPEPKADPAHESAGPPVPPHADASPQEDEGSPPVAAKGPPSDSSKDKLEASSERSDEDSSPSEDKSKDKKPPVTKVTTVEKPTEPKEKVDIKQAAARMRLALAAHVAKEAGIGSAVLGGLKGMGQFAASGAKTLQAAHAAGGMGAVGQAAKTLGGQGLRQAGSFIAKNPAAGAAMIAAPAAAAGYAAGR